MKVNEDWLAVIFGFTLLVLSLVGVIGPTWIKF